MGIPVAPDGSEDERINIIGLEDYSVESDDEDPVLDKEDEEYNESEDEAEDEDAYEDPSGSS